MKKFYDLVNNDKYAVYLLSSRAYIPFGFARYPWFVLNKNGVLSRWEIRHYKNYKNQKYLFVDEQPPFQGINFSFLFFKKIFRKAKLDGCISGDEAKEIITFIENSDKNYPFSSRCCFWGPNSNTYAGWVLDNFPNFKAKLSWRYIGSGFKNKK